MKKDSLKPVLYPSLVCILLRIITLPALSFSIFFGSGGPDVLAGDEDEPGRLWRRKLDHKSAPDPLGADINLDGRLDIVLANLSEEVIVLDSSDGSFLWQEKIGEPSDSLRTPVAGNFLGRQSINIIVPTASGTLFILDGPTGKLINTIECGHPIELPVAAFPWTRQETVNPFREGILLYHPIARKLTLNLIQSGGTLNELTTFDTGGFLDTAPVVGKTDLDALEPHVSFVTKDGRILVISGHPQSAGVAASHKLPNDRVSNRGVTLGDLDGDGSNEIIIADDNGFLRAFKVNKRDLVPFWTHFKETDKERNTENITGKNSISTEPSAALVTIDINHDGADDIITLHDSKNFRLTDGRTGWPIGGEEGTQQVAYYHQHEVLSPISVFQGADRHCYAVFCDENYVCRLDLNNLQVGSYKIGRADSSPVVGDLTGAGFTEAFVRTSVEGTGFMIDLKVPFGLDGPSWLGYRSGSTRSGQEARQYHEFWKMQHAWLGNKMEALLRQSGDSAESGDWGAALNTVGEIRDMNPSHRKAIKRQRYYFFRRHILWIIPTALIVLGLLGYMIYILVRYSRALIQRTLAHKAIASDNHERAIGFLHNLCMKFPRNRSFVSELGSLYIRQKSFDEESSIIFERACTFYPEQEKYLKALATSYSSGPRFDEKSVKVYHDMTRIAKKPGPWFFILGQNLMQLDRPVEALEAFRQTILQQHDDPMLPYLMSTLYIQLGIHTPEIIPTLERVFDQRREEPAFLNTYCLALQEARQYDEKAQQIAQWLLEKDPGAASGHLILATRLLQAGKNKEAMLHSEKVLENTPNHSVGLRLLGACYAAEHRLDQTAMDIFARALESNPEAPEILIAVSHGYIQEERDDTEAREVYTKALVHNSQDELILMQLVRIADKEGDDDLSIRAIEPLLELGCETRELVLQLANAYCRQGIIEEKAEPIYCEALVLQPDHATIQDNLGAIYLRKKSSDVEAAQVFEEILDRHPERVDIGIRLMCCFIEAELPEKALELGDRLHKLDSNNADLQKLMAACSEKADKMDSAIARYEQVIQSVPDDHESICALSQLYGRKRLTETRAVETYQKAIQFQPNEPVHFLAATRAHASREEWEQSIQTLKNMLTQNPDQMAQAISLMEELVESHPRQFKFRWYLIDTLIFEGRLRDARENLTKTLRIDPKQSEIALLAFEKILEKNPKDALSHLELGRILYNLGREQESRQSLEQAHRYHPDNQDIMRNLIGLYQKLLKKRESAEIQFKLGRLAMRMDKHDLAISCFQTTSKDYRWEGESIRNLAQCFKAKGMLDLALQELKRLPMEGDVKDLMYDLGQRYEAVNDIQGAREVYKLIFASDITYKDVKGKLESLSEMADAGGGNAERTAILNSLSDEAKQRYELVQELGRGSMGIVYKAKDTELDEFVALKILPDTLIRNQEAVRRFKQEARNARKLSHPNIVRIHDIGEEMGRKYISMEFVEGSDLKARLRKFNRKLPFKDVVKYALELSDAMAYAHQVGIVHRDIKPANLMLTKDDHVKVTDFGIAKMVEQTNASDQTQAGVIIGTPLYMSPEQVKGQSVDYRADIYSMGVVLYELASGRPPFTEGDLSYQHLFVEPTPLENVPEQYCSLVMKCLAKSVEERWQSAKEVSTQLKEVPVEEA
jgi:tetratricopeptide (TPR) repeat protein